jgi:hypothetical protein
MNAQLSHQMAQFRQQDLHRQAERARMARAVATEGRLRAICRRIMSTRSHRPQPQSQAAPPVAGAVSKA